MKSISPYQKRWCLRIDEKLRSMNITKLLDQEMQKRQASINFANIHSKLNDDQYLTASDWVRDVNLIWFSEKNYYDKDTPFYYIIDFLQKWFEKKVETIPSTEEDDWFIRFRKIQKEVKRLMKIKQPNP